MNEVHLTNASIPGVRCLREMKASTNKRRRDTTYTSKIIEKTVRLLIFGFVIRKKANNIGNRKAVPVRTAEETRHSIASPLEGKWKNHPIQCIPPNTPPTMGIQKKNAVTSLATFMKNLLIPLKAPPRPRWTHESLNMTIHLKDKSKLRMTKTMERKIEKVRAKMNGITIIQQINIKILLRMGRGRQMVVSIC